MKTEDFYPLVLPEVMGCPDPMLRQAVVMAAIDFCRESLCWTQVSDPVPLINGVMDYELDTPMSAYAITVRDVWLGMRRLSPVSMQALQRVMPNWITATSTEPVYYNSATDRGSIRVFPTPADIVDQSLVVRAAFMPTAVSTTLPDFLGQRYMDVISSGAKARLMAIPLQTWSNPNLAAFYLQKFDSGVINSRIEEAHDRVPGSISVAPRRFGF